MLDDGSDLVMRTPAERAAIVAEAHHPGATVAGVALSHGIVASQLSSRRTIAKGKADRDKRHLSDFAEIIVATGSRCHFGADLASCFVTSGWNRASQ